MQPTDRAFIMIMGMPRSGTTWVGKIFDSHPDTLYRHEPDTVRPHDEYNHGPRGEESEGYEEGLLRYVDELLGMRATRCVTKPPWFKKSYRPAWATLLRTPVLHFYRVASRFLGEIDVPDQVSRARRDQVRYVWKSIESTLALGRIARITPASRSIALLRHPCGYVASILRGSQRSKFTTAVRTEDDRGILQRIADSGAAQARRVSVDDLLALTPAHRLAWTWVAYNDALVNSVRTLGNVRIQRYEDLCADPRAVAEDMFAFTGLAWNPQTERFIASSTGREDDSYYSVFKNPEHAANKWRSELDAEEIEAVQGVIRGTGSGDYYPDTRF